MAEDAIPIDRRGFMVASAVGLATAAGCNAIDGDGGSNDTDEEPTPVRVGYGGVPVEADLETEDSDPADDDPADPDSDTGTDDSGETGDDGGGGGGGGGGGYGGYGGGDGGGSDDSQPTITFVQVDGDLYGAPYDGQRAETIPYDDPEDDPCLGYGNGPYGGVVEEGETPACREIES